MRTIAGLLLLVVLVGCGTDQPTEREQVQTRLDHWICGVLDSGWSRADTVGLMVATLTDEQANESFDHAVASTCPEFGQ